MLNFYHISQKALQFGVFALALYAPTLFAYESTFILETALDEINLNVGEEEYVDFVVTNNTPYQLTQNGLMYPLPAGVSLVMAEDTCAESFTLAPKGQAGSSCVLRLLVAGVTETSYQLKPEICHTPVSQLYCDIPAADNRPVVTVGSESPEVFILTTTTTEIKLAVGQPQTVEYLVTNNTTQTLTGNSLNRDILPEGVTQLSGGCNETFDLDSGASCIMSLKVEGVTVTDFHLVPEVCNPSLGCSIPALTSQPSVDIIPAAEAFVITTISPEITVKKGETVPLEFIVTNNTTVVLEDNEMTSTLPIGVMPDFTGLNTCHDSFDLNPLGETGDECTLRFAVTGEDDLDDYEFSPQVCNAPPSNLCTTAPTVTFKVIPDGEDIDISAPTKVALLPGGTVTFTVTNEDAAVAAQNVIINLPDAYESIVDTPQYNNCNTVAPLGTCTITLQTVGEIGSVLAEEATIQGSNTIEVFTELWPAGVSVTVPEDAQHFQTQQLAVAQASDYTNAVTLDAPVVSIHSDFVHTCAVSTDPLCQYPSTCVAGSIAVGSTCYFEFQSLQANGQAFTTENGNVQINLSEPNGTNYKYIAPMTYHSMLMMGGGNDVRYWDGLQWNTFVEVDTSSAPLTFVTWKGDLYVAGDYNEIAGVAANNIAKWDSRNWTNLAQGVGTSTSFVYNLDIFNNSLYAAGIFSTASGVTVNNIANWNGATWNALAGTGIGTNGVIYDVAEWNGSLYVAGNFSQAGGVAVHDIASWDTASWSDVGGGVTDNTGIGAIAATAIGNNLYVGGGFSVPGNAIASWNGTGWSPLGNGLGNAGLPLLRQVNTIAGSASNDLYAGGLFEVTGDDVTVNNIAHWNGNTWQPLGTGNNVGTDGPLAHLLVWGDHLYVRGCFTSAGGIETTDVAAWNITTEMWEKFDYEWGAPSFCDLSDILPVSSVTIMSAP